MQDFSIFKSRIKEYLKYKGVRHARFYEYSGITRGILMQKNGISEDNLAKFLDYAQDINPAWLLKGDGDMIISNVLAAENIAIDNHTNNARKLKKGSYADEFVENLLIDHSKLTDAHQKLAESHYLLTVEATDISRQQRNSQCHRKQE